MSDQEQDDKPKLKTNEELDEMVERMRARLAKQAPVRYYIYQCADPTCKEPDPARPGQKRTSQAIVKCGEQEPFPAAIDCWNCHGGRGKSLELMVEMKKQGNNRGAGMHPLKPLLEEVVAEVAEKKDSNVKPFTH